MIIKELQEENIKPKSKIVEMEKAITMLAKGCNRLYDDGIKLKRRILGLSPIKG